MPASVRTAAAEQEIIDRLSAGEPLAVICRDDHMPGLRTVYDWCAADEGFSARIARARDAGEEAILASCLGIADDSTDEPQSRKVRVWTRLELLKRWNPRKWGDKVQTELTGPNGGAVQTEGTLKVEFVGNSSIPGGV